MIDRMVDMPVLIINRRLDVLAWNPLAAAVICDFASIPVDERNIARLLFLDARVRSLYVDWEDVDVFTVAILHVLPPRGSVPGLSALVGELSVRSPDCWHRGQLPLMTKSTAVLKLSPA